MKRFSSVVLLLLFICTSVLRAQMLLPKPDPPRAVNDFAGVLNPSQNEALESKLRAFTDSTSNAIVVVIVNDLQGYDRSDFAYRIGRDWGVGRQEFGNGVVVLVKPKTEESSGQAFIATGKGLEGAIPDLACADIIDREMIPKFREGDYYGGIDAATTVLMALASGEYNYDNYKKGGGNVGSAGSVPAIFFIVLIVIVILAIKSGNSNNRHIGKRGSSNLPLWILLGMMGSGKSHGGGFGGFSGGGGFGGGGGGGFGGFGGGGFGGGGAGGSW